MIKAYGFFPQMKAEGIAFKAEKSGAIVIGTNPGYQNGVLIVYELSEEGRNNDGKLGWIADSSNTDIK